MDSEACMEKRKHLRQGNLVEYLSDPYYQESRLRLARFLRCMLNKGKKSDLGSLAQKWYKTITPRFYKQEIFEIAQDYHQHLLILNDKKLLMYPPISKKQEPQPAEQINQELIMGIHAAAFFVYETMSADHSTAFYTPSIPLNKTLLRDLKLKMGELCTQELQNYIVNNQINNKFLDHKNIKANAIYKFSLDVLASSTSFSEI